MKESTLAIHGGIDGDETTGAVNVPIYQTSTYRQRALGETTGWEYSRTGNPTRAALEKLVADLEGGSHGFAFGSGMAAIAAVLSLFRSGDRILLSKNVYGGTFRILDKVFNSFGLTYSLEDTDDIAALEKAVTPDVKALLVETPANPLLAVTNLKAVAALAKRHGILLVVDNTFMTPYFQNPILEGADIVVHSGTKYLSGHNDTVCGFVCSATRDLADRFRLLSKTTGAALAPFDSWLCMRGLKTLALRMERHKSNAEKVRAWLLEQNIVRDVYYAGSGMISFTVDSAERAEGILKNIRLITFAESLGGAESLLTYPTVQTHPDVPAEQKERLGISDRLLRLSVGIENPDDILADLEQAFHSAL